ncbi:MAG: response regulator [Cytophagaceae bacterium]|jgi:CheY-like chemotaxis protein|nr:response regulator [Cytophagaceae bacterium]
MKQTPKCIMLIDDNADDNFYHERVIRKSHTTDNIIVMHTAIDALEYLKSEKNNDTHPDLIFLDINMPGMNGWEFLVEYNKLEKRFQSRAIVVMLTTSDNPDDKKKAKSSDVASEFRTKPLTPVMLEEVVSKYFNSGTSSHSKATI